MRPSTTSTAATLGGVLLASQSSCRGFCSDSTHRLHANISVSTMIVWRAKVNKYGPDLTDFLAQDREPPTQSLFQLFVDFAGCFADLLKDGHKHRTAHPAKAHDCKLCLRTHIHAHTHLRKRCCAPKLKRPARLEASPPSSRILTKAVLICSFHCSFFSPSGWKITPAFPTPTSKPRMGSGFACCSLRSAIAVAPSMHLTRRAKHCFACSAHSARSAVK